MVFSRLCFCHKCLDFILCAAGGGGDPGGAGEVGASEEPAHPWAEEDPQWGQLSVRSLLIFPLFFALHWCVAHVCVVAQLKLFPILCRFKDHPTLNDRYLLLHLLGRGGFSEVYKVRFFFFSLWTFCPPILSMWQSKGSSFVFPSCLLTWMFHYITLSWHHQHFQANHCARVWWLFQESAIIAVKKMMNEHRSPDMKPKS